MVSSRIKGNRIGFPSWWALLPTLLLLTSIGQAQETRQQEEQEDYYSKWLKEDVVYIISEEEEDVFHKLQTDEEKENFIEQFWRRRDTDPETAFNEFKEEHYRRISYANENFASGQPGWKMDRGIMYIRFGPPDRKETRPTGGEYERTTPEGGGRTNTFPFEKWEYRFIPGVGDDVELEFVDDTLSGEYRLTMNPDDKDALLLIGEGPTLGEEFGTVSRRDRILNLTNPTPLSSSRFIGYGRQRDQPFEKLQLFTNLQKPPSQQFDDLRRPDITSNITYDTLPFQVGVDHLLLDDRTYLVPVNVMVPNESLDFEAAEEGFTSVVEVYGRITTLGGKIAETFEEMVINRQDSLEDARDKAQKSLYQKSVRLAPGRYKLDLIVRSDATERIGIKTTGIVLPPVSNQGLRLSSVVLADRVAPGGDEMEHHSYGIAKVIPNMSRVFDPSQSLLVFFQVSNFQIDEASSGPSLLSGIEISKDSETVLDDTLKIDSSDTQNRDRLHLVHELELDGMTSGKYQLRLKVQDKISGESLERNIPFQIAKTSG